MIRQFINVKNYGAYFGSNLSKYDIPCTTKVSRQKSFKVFVVFCVPAKLFYMKVQDAWRCLIMDLRETMWDSTKVFCEDLCVQVVAKLFDLETFMVAIAIY